jgi:hypothetical protein
MSVYMRGSLNLTITLCHIHVKYPQANIASYDYSALLYFSTQRQPQRGHTQKMPRKQVTGQTPEDEAGGFEKEKGEESEEGTDEKRHANLGQSTPSSSPGFDQRLSFEGGSFVFQDSDADRFVSPTCGRLVSFSSGLENVHRVERVTSGSRLVLAMWFTCSPSHAYDDDDDT